MKYNHWVKGDNVPFAHGGLYTINTEHGQRKAIRVTRGMSSGLYLIDCTQPEQNIIPGKIYSWRHEGFDEDRADFLYMALWNNYAPSICDSLFGMAL